MFIGTTKIDYTELLKHRDNMATLCDFVNDLVPKWARVVPGILDNQRFYVALHLRKVLSIPYKERMQMANVLLANTRIEGVMSDFVQITDVLDVCDKEALARLFEEKLNATKQ